MASIGIGIIRIIAVITSIAISTTDSINIDMNTVGSGISCS
jgi:hypothetical protein